MIHTIIFMEPVGKGRPRITMKGGRAIAYTPSKTAHAENIIRDKVMEMEMFFPREIPLSLVAIFFRDRPKNLPKKVEKPVTRPDWDNYAKLLTDALEKFVYANDSQITMAVIKKRFGSPPRIELMIDRDMGI